MPYTPPAQQSPAASNPSSPALSRSQSFMKAQLPSPEAPAPNGKTALPRSTGSSSYLSKHRRSPSTSKIDTSSPYSESSRKNGGVSGSDAHDERGKLDPHGSIRRSPTPVNNSLIPLGATLSPPESSHNSSDEEESTRGRGRTFELGNLAELHAAICVIEQKKEGSPNGGGEEVKRARMALDIAIPHLSKEYSPAKTNHTPLESPRLPLSKEARKISHSRASTDSSIIFYHEHQAHSPVQLKQDTDEDDEDDSDEANPDKPPMVRKKSGELVRPALRPSFSKRRPSSMPGTPTYSKAVHFDSHLEHVRHFLQVDKPLAVSAGSSPVENHESEIEFPFDSEHGVRSKGPSFEWKIHLTNFPADTEDRHHMPVRVERVFLSSDNKNLVGAVAVHNLAFQKWVAARFTLDYWKTTSEVVADFNNDVRKKQQEDGCDRFMFSIKLEDLANLENKTMFFCVRYSANGKEHWDNNNGLNYQVDFSKKPKQQHGKNGMLGLGARPLSALPRSRRAPPMSSGSRPRGMPVSFDDFASGIDRPYAQSPSSIVGDSPIRLKAPRPRAELVPDAPTRRNNPNGQAFGKRYDFGASLSAAIQNASAILGDQSGFSQKPDVKQSSREVPTSVSRPVTSPQQRAQGVARAPTPSVTPSTIISQKPSLSSQSYQELVDKYCFFGSSKSSPQLTESTLGLVDGANDTGSISDVSVGSVSSSGSSTPAPLARSDSPSAVFSLGSSTNAPNVQKMSPSSSPTPRAGSVLNSRTASPISFGYPYHQPLQKKGFFSDAQTPTAIHG